MAVAWVNNATATSSGATNSSAPAITLATWTPGALDCIIISVGWTSGSSTINTPAGYSLLGYFPNATGSSLALFYKRAVSGDSASTVTFTLSGSTSWAVNARVYSSVFSINNIGLTTGSGSATLSIAATGTMEGTVIAVAFYESRIAASGPTITAHPAGYGNTSFSSAAVATSALMASSDLSVSAANTTATSATASATGTYVTTQVILGTIGRPQRLVKAQAVNRVSRW